MYRVLTWWVVDGRIYIFSVVSFTNSSTACLYKLTLYHISFHGLSLLCSWRLIGLLKHQLLWLWATTMGKINLHCALHRISCKWTRNVHLIIINGPFEFHHLVFFFSAMVQFACTMLPFGVHKARQQIRTLSSWAVSHFLAHLNLKFNQTPHYM